MTVSVTMPALGESVTEGTVTRWLKQVGEQVQADEPLLEVSTDKVDTEIPAPATGTLVEIKVNEDETVAVGADLAVIGGSGAAEAAPSRPEPAPQAAPKPAAEAEPRRTPEPASQRTEAAPEPAPQPRAESPAPSAGPAPAEPPAGEDGSGGGYVTPLVRKLAAEHRVDLSRLHGTGVGGRIRKQDVLEEAERQRAAATKPAPAASTSAPAKPTPSPLRGR